MAFMRQRMASAVIMAVFNAALVYAGDPGKMPTIDGKIEDG